MIGEGVCKSCGTDVENVLHVFRDCQLIKVIAFGSSWVLEWDTFKMTPSSI